MDDPNKGYVTHGEFQQYSAQTNQRFDQLSRSMDHIAVTLDKIRDSRSTNWGQLIGIAGFLSVLVALYVGPLMERSTRNDEAIRDMQTNRNTSDDARALEQRLQSQITDTRERHGEVLIERAKWMGMMEERVRWHEKLTTGEAQ